VYNYTGEGGRRNTAQYLAEGLLNRVRMAPFGSVVVVAPLLFMTLHRTLLTTLRTTYPFVLAVRLVCTWAKGSTEPKDILTATAAYAAILVVIVETTLPA